MKLRIEKYRSIINQKTKIKFGKINYFIGNCKSGRTNILKAINFIGQNSNETFNKKDDETILSSAFLKSEEKSEAKKEFNDRTTKFEIREGDKVLEVSSKKETSWLIADSKRHSNLRKIFEDNKEYLDELSTSQPESAKTIEETTKLIESEFPNIEKLSAFFSIPTLNPNIEVEIQKIYKGIKIEQPFTYLINPDKGVITDEYFQYPLDEVNKPNSQINAIFSCFGNATELEDIFSKNADDKESLEKRDKFLDLVNLRIVKFFREFENDNVTPELSIEGSKININVNIKEKEYEVETTDIVSESLKYKYYSKLLLEIYAFSKASNNNSRTIYMVNQPEKFLCFKLQKSLVSQVKASIMEEKNISVVIATNSPSLFNLDDNVALVERNSNNETLETIFGETVIKKINVVEITKNDDIENKFIRDIVLNKWKSLLLKEQNVRSILSSNEKGIADLENGKKTWSEFIEELHASFYVNLKRSDGEGRDRNSNRRFSGNRGGSGRSFGGNRGGSNFGRRFGGNRGGSGRSFGDRNRSSGGGERRFDNNRSSEGSRENRFGDRDRSSGGGERRFDNNRSSDGSRENRFGDRNRSSGGGERRFDNNRSSEGSRENRFGDRNRSSGGRENRFGDRNRSSGGRENRFGDRNRSSGGGERRFDGDKKKSF